MKISMYLFFGLLVAMISCKPGLQKDVIYEVKGRTEVPAGITWLTHEHLLVDFTGAGQYDPEGWDRDSVIAILMPYLEELKKYDVDYFVDATPAYLGRDVRLMEKISERTGLHILTNTGFYGARQNKFVPAFVREMGPVELSELWISEFENGIDGTGVKPGFIKIGVDNTVPLDSLHVKLVKAAALAHLRTGLTIASHTGEAKAMWPQLEILEGMGVSPEAFIWVHAQAEKDNNEYLEAAGRGCWISLDGMGWETENHIEKILFAKEHGILDRILLSHDAGWYDPQKSDQDIKPYTNLFTTVIPVLESKGFTEEEIMLLTCTNPAGAFAVGVRRAE